MLISVDRCKNLVKKLTNVSLSVSYTTRNKRKNEINGRDYFFVSKEEFMQLKNNNKFIEHAKVFNNYYATSREEIKKILCQGAHAILEIDWQGARKLRKKFSKNDYFQRRYN